MPRVREDRIALALLALLLCLAFSNVIFGGRSLVASDNLNPLWPDLTAPAEWHHPELVSYPNYRDPISAIMQSDPSREFLRRSLLRGEYPWWDPYVGGGGPSHAAMWPAYLFPPSLLVVLLGAGGVVRNAYILLLILTSGMLTWFLLRRHALSAPAALAGAIAFAFSGAIIQTVPSVLGQPLAFFSLPLLVTARLVDRPDASRAAQLALAFAFVALASFPPALLQIFGMCVVYVLVTKRGRAAFGWFAAGAAVSLALSAIAYLPAMRLMGETTHIRDFYKVAAQAAMPLSHVGQILSPTLMGGVPIYSHSPLMGAVGLHFYYSGIVAVFLAMIGLAARSRDEARVLRVAASACGVFALGKAIGLPPFQWIAYVPLLRDFHYAAYIGFGLAYCIAILAALGIDALLAGRVRSWHVAFAAAMPGLVLAGARLYAWRHDISSHAEAWRWFADFRLLVVFGVTAVIAAWMAGRSPQLRAASAIALTFLLAVEGVKYAHYPRPLRGDIWSHPPRYVDVIAQQHTLGRVLPMPIYPANTESVFRQPTIDVILTASPRMFDFYVRYFRTTLPVDPIPRESDVIPPERVLDAANIELLAIGSFDPRHIQEAEGRGYATLYADPLVHVMRRATDARYTFTSQYRVVRSGAGAREALPTLPRGMVLVEETPSFSSRPGAAGKVVVTKFALNEVALTVDAPRAGLLVCSESNFSGWTARVDGRPTRILAANYAFRAIEVPPGTHKVTLTYTPPGRAGGVALSLLGLILCGGALQSRHR